MEIKQPKRKNILQLIGIGCIFLIPVTASVFYALRLPVSFDEAWTFLNFTIKSWSASMCHYPAPNNHIFHSVITKITYHIPTLPNLFKLRLSSIIANLIYLIVCYRFVSKHFNQKMALVCVAVASVLFMNIYYSYMSRGYGLMNLYFIVTLFCAFNIIKGENNYKNWLIFSIFSILGFYTIPVFLYLFAALNLLIFIFRVKNSRNQLLFNAGIIIAVFLLYLPVILNDGIGSITNNAYVKPIGLYETVRTFPSFARNMTEEITGIYWIFMALALAVSGYFIMRSKSRLFLCFSLAMLFVPLILLTIQRVIPFARVFNYYGFVIVLVVFMPFSEKIKTINYGFLIPGIIIVQLLLVLNFERKIYDYEDRDQALNSTAGKIIPKIIGNKKYLFDNSLLAANLEFELIAKGFRSYEIKNIRNLKISADTISNYDFLIIGKEMDATRIKEPYLSTEYYSIYNK